MTDPDAARSYDDLPEADVATVLQVPLLWGHSTLTTPPGVSTGAHRQQTGRHRASRPTLQLRPAARPKAGLKAKPRTRRRATSHWFDHPMVHTAQVGLVSATLVLAIFAAVLLVLALLLP